MLSIVVSMHRVFGAIVIANGNDLTLRYVCYPPGGQVLADNHFFPTNFTDVALPAPKITVGDYNQTEDKMTINVCNSLHES